jgi:hypothetical protein
MAVTNADILGWLNANPGADDALIASTMQSAGLGNHGQWFGHGSLAPWWFVCR